MSKNELVAFGLDLTVAALNARANKLSCREQVFLAEKALEYAGDDKKLCEAVRLFLVACKTDQRRAGLGLFEFLSVWPTRSPNRYDWQNRADLR